MAVLPRVATFTAEQGPKVISFPTPSGNFVVRLAAPTLTVEPTAGVSCWLDAPQSSGGTTTVNVYASDSFSGSVPATIEDIP